MLISRRQSPGDQVAERTRDPQAKDTEAGGEPTERKPGKGKGGRTLPAREGEIPLQLHKRGQGGACLRMGNCQPSKSRPLSLRFFMRESLDYPTFSIILIPVGSQLDKPNRTRVKETPRWGMGVGRALSGLVWT